MENSKTVFCNTYSWTYILEDHEDSEKSLQVVLYADNKKESLKKLKLLGLGFDVQEFRLSYIEEFEPYNEIEINLEESKEDEDEDEESEEDEKKKNN